MTVIIAVSRDLGVLRRWSGVLADAGHELHELSADDWSDRVPAGTTVCLYDLGSHGDADQLPLIAALSCHASVRFIAMTARPNADEGLSLLRQGVRGYCNRLASAEAVVALVSTVEQGEIWAGRQVTDFLLSNSLAAVQSVAHASDSLLDQLTVREKDIAQQVAAGRSNKVIAADSGISERTVKAHLNAIFRKTGIRNRVQLALEVSQGSHDGRRMSSG